MKPGSSVVFGIASVAREICWMSAWAAFTLQALFQRTYPLFDAVGIYVASAIVMQGTRRTNLRFAHGLLIQAAALACVLIRSVHTAWYPTESFWELGWWHAVSTPRSQSEWLALAGVGFWSLALWSGGVQHARRSRTYADACSRFDKGLTWLFALLFLKLLLRGELGPARLEQLSDALIYPFVASGLLAVAIARSRSPGHKRFIRGYRAIGLASSFAGLLLVLGLSCGLLYVPGLHAAADTSYTGLKTVGRPVASAAEDVVAFILRLLNVSPMRVLPDAKGPTATGSGSTRLGSAQLPSAAQETSTLWMWLGAGATLALLLAFLYHLGRELLSTGKKATRGESAWARMRSWLRRLRSALAALFCREHAREPIRLYVELLSWGRRSGLRHHSHETPTEYAERLKATPLGVADRIDVIVSVFHAHVYGQVEVDPEQVTRARRAMRQLQSPLFWPARLRTWLASADTDGVTPGAVRRG
jgi:hypothetical protein